MSDSVAVPILISGGFFEKAGYLQLVQKFHLVKKNYYIEIDFI
ncbi:MAG: hypothetical protein H6R26_56 [Proteobacteria bacterium]|jgi:hypothetical protein|nr:hypothetical protein [Pseudomonadota bacterium]